MSYRNAIIVSNDMRHRLRAKYHYSTVLLRELVKTDFKLRYQGSVLGYTWSLLRPLFLFVILYVVFTRFLRLGSDVPNYPVYLLLGIVLWNYFIEITTGNIAAIVSKGDLIRKINFPKYVIVLAGCVSAMINLVLNFIVIAIFMVIAGVDIRVDAVWAMILLGELTLFALGIAFLLSALFVRYRDISYVWEVMMQAAFYATPIIYPLALIPEKAQKIVLLNPLAQIIQDVRNVLVTPQTVTLGDVYGSPIIWLFPFAIVLCVSVASMLFFRKRSRSFAEEV